MTEKKIEQCMRKAFTEIKAEITDLSFESKIVSELGFESIDVIDLFFEIQLCTQIEIDLNELSLKIGVLDGRRFNDITPNDILIYLKEKVND